MDFYSGLVIGWLAGCVFTYVVLYLPTQKLNKGYIERLENRLKEKYQ
jgi:hypothetical protein